MVRTWKAVCVDSCQAGRPARPEHAAAGLAVHRLVDGGLEPPEVDHDVGQGHGGDLAGGQLHVVRFDTGLGQAGDRHPVSTDAGGGVLDGVEAGCDLSGVATPGHVEARGVAAGGRAGRHQHYGCGGREEPARQHDNHSQSK